MTSRLSNTIENNELVQNALGALNTSLTMSVSNLVRGAELIPSTKLKASDTLCRLINLHTQWTMSHILGSNIPKEIWDYVRESDEVTNILIRAYIYIGATEMDDGLAERLVRRLATCLCQVSGVPSLKTGEYLDSTMDKAILSEMCTYDEAVDAMMANSIMTVVVLLSMTSTDYLYDALADVDA